MNQFSHILGSYTELGIEPYREIVTIVVDLSFDGTFLGRIERKYKNGSKRADVNAFHMHRSLCTASREASLGRAGLDKASARRLYSCLADIVGSAYVLNVRTGSQAFRFAVDMKTVIANTHKVVPFVMSRPNIDQDGKLRILEG